MICSLNCKHYNYIIYSDKHIYYYDLNYNSGYIDHSFCSKPSLKELNYKNVLLELKIYFNGSEKYKQFLAKKIKNIILNELLEYALNPNRIKY